MAPSKTIPWRKDIFTPAFTGLLDQSFASGATAAYSLRRLKSSATKAVRVREDSGNTETDIGFSGGALDETALLNHVGSNNGFVTKWYDQSGNGNDASNSTASEQPQIVSSGSVIKENGKPALEFDGIDDFLNNPNPDLSFNPSYFIFAVSLLSNGARILDSVTSFGNYIILNANGGSIRFFESDPLNLGNGFNLNQNVIGEANHVGSNAELFQNGSSLGSGTVGASTGEKGITIGTGNNQNVFFEGFYAELIIYNEDKATDRSNIYSNVNNYWR